MLLAYSVQPVPCFKIVGKGGPETLHKNNEGDGKRRGSWACKHFFQPHSGIPAPGISYFNIFTRETVFLEASGV